MTERPHQPDEPNPDIRLELDSLPQLHDPLPEDVWWRTGARSTIDPDAVKPNDAVTQPPPTPAAVRIPPPAQAPGPQAPAQPAPLPPGGIRINVPLSGPSASPAPPRPTGTPAPPPNAPVAPPFDRPLAPVEQPMVLPGGRKGRRQRRTGGRRWVRILRRTLAALVVVLIGLVAFGWYRFRQIETVPVGTVLSAGSAGFTNYLIVGSDSREGIDPNDPNAAAILGDEELTTQRTDAIMIMQVRGGQTSLISFPRDLIVPGESDRINTAYARGGPAGLIATLQDGLGVPVHHYAEVDLAGFLDLVGAAGGVNITFDAPARDLGSGLLVDRAGDVRLDETQALAYVRSRKYERLVDGVWQPELLGDLDRVVRQQTFIRAVGSEVAGTRNPIKLVRFSGAMSRSLKVDDNLGFIGVVQLAARLRGFQPASAQIPVVPFTTADGRAVLGLGDGADAVLAPYRG